ncbi:hypothetical protein OUZ56_000700 [Daphnia magna]|uniref:Uncharacterized protein n=1 Tax=Daphnia magna TaxID=35525 RepID=A0ABR0A150_9CRUS|nr:hypothetical protein OUZ56_000700 [Daphnia magna]
MTPTPYSASHNDLETMRKKETNHLHKELKCNSSNETHLHPVALQPLISLAQQDRHDKTLVVPYKDNEQVADD